MTTITTMRSFFPTDCPLINALSHCAHCNEERQPFTLKMCPECRTAHYCNDDCQQADWKNHQHQCTEDVRFLKTVADDMAKHQGIEVNTDDDDDDDDDDALLFQPDPPKEDCPLCFLPRPQEILGSKSSTYMLCCGNFICNGCLDKIIPVACESESGLIFSCPFCRKPAPTSENETIIRIKDRMEVNDREALYHLSNCYEFGNMGLSKNPQKGFELCLRAAELENSNACARAAMYYSDGVVVQKDLVQSMEYSKMAATNGCFVSRHTLGLLEKDNHNYRDASRHWLISAAAGYTKSLKQIAKCYKFQLVTKEEYSAAFVSYSNVHTNERSIERERTAAAAADAMTL